MDKATAQTYLEAALAARADAVQALALGIGDRQTTRQTLSDLRAECDYWQGVVTSYNTAAAGGNVKAAKACWSGCT